MCLIVLDKKKKINKIRGYSQNSRVLTMACESSKTKVYTVIITNGQKLSGKEG